MSRKSRPTEFRPGTSRAHKALQRGRHRAGRKEADSADPSVEGYSVYLNGDLRHTGWSYYYLAALLYKVPEGTWLLVLLSLVLLALQRRTRESWADEICLWTVPASSYFP